MSSIALEIVVIMVLLVVNGIFSMSEMALVSARKTRLAHRAEAGDAGARAALDLASHPTNFLSTVQVGITLVGVLAGAFGGAGISQVLAESIRDVRWIGEYAEPIGFGIAVSAITYLSLIIGELVPKQIALGNPERIAALIARPMRFLSRLGSPLVALLTGSTKFVFRLFGVRATVEPGITEQDIRAMVEQGAETGVVEPVEHEIVENTFRIGDRRVRSIMTPRPDVYWIDVNSSPEHLREQVVAARWAPWLVCDGSVEKPVGFIEAEDLLVAQLSGAPLAPRALARESIYVPDTMPVFKVLEAFRSAGQHGAVVLDEFGGFAGMVTVDDIVEALVPLPAAEPGQPSEIQRQPDGSWLIDGAAALDDVLTTLDVDPPAGKRDIRVDTIGGLVMALMGRIPVGGDTIQYGELALRVERITRRRVVLVRAWEGRAPPTS